MAKNALKRIIKGSVADRRDPANGRVETNVQLRLRPSARAQIQKIEDSRASMAQRARSILMG